jgi:sn-glycerol 3-phosphate transport system ATP-binding protein
MAAVEIRNVTKSWGPTLAVDDISFSVAAGNLVALLGPSGCGKSTTLRLIAGLEDATSGVIRIAGRDVTHEAPAARGIAMVFQSYALFPHLSVAENIVFGLKVRAVPRAEREARLKEAAGILGLEPYLSRKPSQLSGGQQQRVALGRAIVARTPVCLMDEPLSNLDAQLRVEMRREIRDLQRRLGITMVYVTHDQVEAMTMADQVVLMRNGRIEQDAPPAELYEKPQTIFVARFVGTPPMNVVPLSAIAAASEGTPPPVPAGRDPASLAIGIRPEQVEIGEGGVGADIVAVEYLGADTLVETRIAGEPFIVRRPGRVQGAPGERIGLILPTGAAHWFDLTSEARIETP